MVFLAPMGAHNAIAVEAWQAVAQWDVQRDADGTVNAVRYGAREGDPEHTQTLANLKSRVTAATTATSTTATSTAATTTRIASVSGLAQYYRDIGAYSDITPGDNATTTFTPAQPPAAYACATGAAVTNPGANRGLVHDCEALLDARDTLRGTATLDWSASSTMSTWRGVTLNASSTRVSALVLDDEGLDGTIPAALGGLFELTRLDLSDNSLTGEIPRELGWLTRLTRLRLGGNSLTGCVPESLRDVADHDLANLRIPYCDPAPAPQGVSVSLSSDTFTISWNAVSGADRYRVQHRTGGADGEWTSLDAATSTSVTYSPEGGVACGTTYEFRAQARGDGETHVVAWSEPSGVVSRGIGRCYRPPVFATSTYAFPVAENAPKWTVVGDMLATDPDPEDFVTYHITAGNADGKFIAGSTNDGGQIVVWGALDYESVSSYTLTVEARDGNGGTARATVHISVTNVAEGAPPAPRDVSVSLSGETFTISWSAVSGADRYRAQYRTGGSGDWTNLSTATSTSATFSPEGGVACETAYEFRVQAQGDGETHVVAWGQPSEPVSHTTGPCNRAPAFSTSTYAFSVAEDAAASAVVGSVSADDPDDDTVSYSIASGNDEGKFSVYSDTGDVVVAGALDYESVSSYTLTVEARDGNGGAATSTVVISVTDVAD